MTTYRAIFHDAVIAESDDAVIVEGNVYFPLEAVRFDVLRPSRMKSLCFWKGVASYYTLDANGISEKYAAWTYRHPSPLARAIKNRVAFWGGVRVEAVEESRR